MRQECESIFTRNGFVKRQVGMYIQIFKGPMIEKL